MSETDKYVAKLLQDNERKWKQIEADKAAKEATRTVIKNAAIGGIVAGPAGAVVGAIVGKTKVDSLTSTTEQPLSIIENTYIVNEPVVNPSSQSAPSVTYACPLYYQYSIDDEVPVDLDEPIRVRMMTNIKAKNAEGKFSSHYLRIRDLNAIIGVLQNNDNLSAEDVCQYLSEQSLNITVLRVKTLLRDLVKDNKVKVNEIQRTPYYSLRY